MKYIWEEQDIHTGRRVSSWNRAEDYIVGFDPSIHSEKQGGPGKPAFALISLRDGMIVAKDLSRQGLVDHLNKGGYRPNSIHDEDAKNAQPPSYKPAGGAHG